MARPKATETSADPFGETAEARRRRLEYERKLDAMLHAGNQALEADLHAVIEKHFDKETADAVTPYLMPIASAGRDGLRRVKARRLHVVA